MLKPKSNSATHRPIHCALICCITLVILNNFASSLRADISTAPFSDNRDTTIFAENPNNSAGANIQIFVGNNQVPAERRGLIGFDIKDHVPAGATVTGVTLSMVLTGVAGTGSGGGGPVLGPLNISLHPLTANWTEGTVSSGGGQGGAAHTGDTTWHYQAFSTTTWTDGGVFDPSVVSATTGVDTNVSTAGNPTIYNWTGGVGSQIVADVQDWLNHQDSDNFGWILTNADTQDAQSFRSFASNNNTSFAGPSLVVTYVAAVPESAAWVLMSLAVAGMAAMKIRQRPAKATQQHN